MRWTRTYMRACATHRISRYIDYMYTHIQIVDIYIFIYRYAIDDFEDRNIREKETANTAGRHMVWKSRENRHKSQINLAGRRQPD